jgi:hypothetical protein
VVVGNDFHLDAPKTEGLKSSARLARQSWIVGNGGSYPFRGRVAGYDPMRDSVGRKRGRL